MIATTMVRALQMERELAVSRCEANGEYCRQGCRRD